LKGLALFLITLAAAGQSPDCSVIPGSTQDGKLREFDTETLYEYMNGNSEGYFLYGFAKMRGVTCKKGAISFVVDVSEFKSPELAYGMFTGNIDPRLRAEKIAAGGQVNPRKVIFVKGQYFGEIAAEPEGEHTAELRAGALALEKKLQGTTEPPAALGWFPKEKLQPGSPRLVPQSVLGLRMLQRGYLALYEQGKAFIVTEASDDAAKALMGRLKERFIPSGAAAGMEDGFITEDRYLGRMCIFRKGSRIAGWTNVPAGQDPAALAGALAKAMP
jgi:hypothetical protein